MKILGITIKKQCILQFKMPVRECNKNNDHYSNNCFYEEPTEDNKNFRSRVKHLKSLNAEIKIKRRFIIEF